MPASDSLQQLIETRGDLWRGRFRRPGAGLPTGRKALDARLPDGGWPRARLIELMPERPGCGELELLLPALASLTRAEAPVMLIAPPYIPCPQHLLAAGLDLTRLLIVRDRGHAFWAAEQALKSGLCGALVLWPEPRAVHERPIRRLQLAAEHGLAPVFLSYAPGSRPPPSLASLRLAIRAGGEIDILRGRLGERGSSLRLAADNVVLLRAGNHAGNGRP